jgi:hypothetical protein
MSIYLDCVSTRELERELSRRHARLSESNFARDISIKIVDKLSAEERCWLRKIIQDQEMFADFCGMLKDVYDDDVREYDP